MNELERERAEADAEAAPATSTARQLREECLKDLVQKDLEGKSRIEEIELVWAIQDPRMS